MKEAPRCFGDFDEESPGCSKCLRLALCKAQLGRVIEKKKKNDAGLTGEEKELIDSLTLISTDPLSRIVKLRTEAIQSGDKHLLAVLNRALMVNLEGMATKTDGSDFPIIT